MLGVRVGELDSAPHAAPAGKHTRTTATSCTQENPLSPLDDEFYIGWPRRRLIHAAPRRAPAGDRESHEFAWTFRDRGIGLQDLFVERS